MQYSADGSEHASTETYEHLISHFALTDDEVNQYLPSGNQKTFYNRVFWAKSHLKMAGLIELTRRGHFRITELGKKIVAGKPREINLKLLKTLPGYLDNVGKPKDGEVLAEQDIVPQTATPEEILDGSYQRIRKNLALELLSKIKACSPSFFENLVVELLVKMGYGGTIQEAGKSIGKSGDGGIDGIIKEDRLGLDTIYIQAKRWDEKTPVGRPEIQKFVGALAGQGAKKGVFITTSRFTNDAKEYQPRNEAKIVLIDGEMLADLMIDYSLAVTTINTYSIKRIDNDYFEDE